MAHERIEINSEIMGGKPVIRGTRIPVEVVLRKLGAGMTVDAILADHPRASRAMTSWRRKHLRPTTSLTKTSSTASRALAR